MYFQFLPIEHSSFPRAARGTATDGNDVHQPTGSTATNADGGQPTGTATAIHSHSTTTDVPAVKVIWWSVNVHQRNKRTL